MKVTTINATKGMTMNFTRNLLGRILRKAFTPTEDVRNVSYCFVLFTLYKDCGAAAFVTPKKNEIHPHNPLNIVQYC